MSGSVEWISGDMFEGPSDLVVVPCSTVPTMTTFTAERLERFAIPWPTKRMALGEVVVEALPQASQVAMSVAYAASVENHSSNTTAIEAIGERLGEHAAANEQIRHVACPLLGTGAGGVHYRDAARALTQGFLETAPDLAVLRVYVFDPEWFEELRTEALERDGAGQATVTLPARPIRVFVTYAHSSDAHKAWVRDLATFLRTNGLDARLDAWHLRPGMDMPQWMSNELDMADRVVVVVDGLYSQKADGRHGGVGWETKLIMGDLYGTHTENPDKYVPVFVEGVRSSDAPSYLKPTLGIEFPDEPGNALVVREQLLRTLFRVYDEAPPIGQPPSFVVGRARPNVSTPPP